MSQDTYYLDKLETSTTGETVNTHFKHNGRSYHVFTEGPNAKEEMDTLLKKIRDIGPEKALAGASDALFPQDL